MDSKFSSDDGHLREIDAAVWRLFFARPGERLVDHSGYWSARLGVRVELPQYTTDATVLSRIEVILRKNGLWTLFETHTQAYDNLERTKAERLIDKLQIAIEIMSGTAASSG